MDNQSIAQNQEKARGAVDILLARYQTLNANDIRELLVEARQDPATETIAERLEAGIAYCEKLRRVQVETDQEANRAALAERVASGEDVPFSLFL